MNLFYSDEINIDDIVLKTLLKKDSLITKYLNYLMRLI